MPEALPHGQVIGLEVERPQQMSVGLRREVAGGAPLGEPHVAGEIVANLGPLAVVVGQRGVGLIPLRGVFQREPILPLADIAEIGARQR
jgi:hypothetical protein